MAEVELARRFRDPSRFQKSKNRTGNYNLLPFNFTKLDDDERYVLSNDAGDYCLVSYRQLYDFVNRRLSADSEIYRELRTKHFLYDQDSDAAIDLLSLKVRSRNAVVRNFTSLHIFVVSLRCDYSCPYCQVSRQEAGQNEYDMDWATAENGLDLVFRSPSPSIKIEFQGGEPLLNFPLIRTIVREAERRNSSEDRSLSFVIATNLTFIDDEILEFCEVHKIFISTSLDGSADLHNSNRPRPGKDGHKKTRQGISDVRNRLGPDYVSALMTTTKKSLSRPREIVNEYLDAGFNSIFLRPISPYGFAIKTRQAEKYDFDRFFAFYKEAMEYIFELNNNGVPFIEHYSSLIVKKLTSPFPTGYVDLQSPSGVGVSAVVVNYDGGVYASDEARMLAEMGDNTLRLGDVNRNTYEEIFLSSTLLDALEDSLAQSAPECSECAFMPYCGSDPTFHHATQGDWVGHKASSTFCERTKKVTSYLIRNLADDSVNREILLDWAS